MKRAVLSLFLMMFFVFTAAQASMESSTQFAAERVLILFDAPSGNAGLGKIYANQLGSLIGHFGLTLEIVPLQNIGARNFNNYRAIFYIGSTYDNPLPQPFTTAIANSERPVVWFKYNLWKVSSDTGFQTRFGFRFNNLVQSGYSTIKYKGKVFTKHSGDPEMGLVSITDTSLAKTYITACGAAGCTPYMLKGRNLWYVADIPFTYMTEDSRYIAFSDVLHDVLGIEHARTRRAVLRIDKITPLTSPDQIRKITNLLYAEKVPFALSVIPVYTDPLGVKNNGVAQKITLSQKPELVEALKYATARGATILLGGHTHQYKNLRNPYTAVTGEDFEFFRVQVDASNNVVLSRPVPEDSPAWAQSKVTQAKQELQKAGFIPGGWHTPAYIASSSDYRVFANAFPLSMQRIALYYPDTKTGMTVPAYSASQYFPFTIHRDIYGQKVIPENLGTFGATRLHTQLITDARRNLVVRDAWAGAFVGTDVDLVKLKEFVKAIKASGFIYISLSDSLNLF